LIDKLKYFDVVSARDSYSAKMMESSGRDVRVVPDLSFWFAKNIASVPCGSAAGRRCVGFTDNVRINQSLHLTCLRRKVGGSPICINYGYEGFYGWLRFLRQGLSMRRDPFRPLFFLGVVIHRHQLWRERFGDTVDFINALSELQLLVSGRFHACTLAIASGTPVIAQASNTRKIESLFRDVGLEEWRLDFNLESCDILDNDDLYWSDEEMANIRFYIEQSVSKAESLFKDLSALVSKS
jgi:Polysaccharide pyruvyl transferase